MSHPEPLVILLMVVVALLCLVRVLVQMGHRRRPARNVDQLAPVVGNQATRRRQVAIRIVGTDPADVPPVEDPRQITGKPLRPLWAAGPPLEPLPMADRPDRDPQTERWIKDWESIIYRRPEDSD